MFRWYQRCFAWALAKGGGSYERLVEARKEKLLGALSGVVLEIGPGAGANVPYYPAGIRLIAVEPNPYMDRYLLHQAAQRHLEIDIHRGEVDRLDLPAASIDAVVSTLVLCSVHDPESALREILRVLKPGGRFVFLEHVGAPRGTWLRRLQRLVRPGWRLFADGCSPDRETWRAIERAGFRHLDLEHFGLPVPIVSPHIAGVGIKG